MRPIPTAVGTHLLSESSLSELDGVSSIPSLRCVSESLSLELPEVQPS